MKKLSVKALAILIVCALVVVVLSVFVIVSSTTKDENRLVYELSEDKTYYTVTDIKNNFRGGWFCKDTLTVPSTHKGLPVTTVARISSTQIKKIVLSDGIKKIGASAFYNEKSSNLESVEIPDSVTSIGNAAFKNCSKLSSITIGKNVKKIGTEAFAACYGLKNIVISEDNVYFKFVNNCIVDVEKQTVMFGGENATIPADGSVIEIGANAFYGNETIASLVIPECIVKIGNAAFKNCTNLASVAWNATKCTAAGGKDGMEIFSGCSSLKTFTVGANVTVIPNNIFIKSVKLNTLTFADTNGWYFVKDSNSVPAEGANAIDLSDASANYDKMSTTNFLIKVVEAE